MRFLWQWSPAIGCTPWLRRIWKDQCSSKTLLPVTRLFTPVAHPFWATGEKSTGFCPAASRVGSLSLHWADNLSASASETVPGSCPGTELHSQQIMLSFLHNFTSEYLDLLVLISQRNRVFLHPLAPQESWLGGTWGLLGAGLFLTVGEVSPRRSFGGLCGWAFKSSQGLFQCCTAQFLVVFSLPLTWLFLAENCGPYPFLCQLELQR